MKTLCRQNTEASRSFLSPYAYDGGYRVWC